MLLRVAFCLTGLLLCFMASPAMADAIILQSSGPSAERFVRGAKITDGAVISLSQGDSVTLLDKGGTRVLRGPVRLTIGSVSAARRDSISKIVNSLRGRSIGRAGAVRSVQTGRQAYREAKPDTIFAINLVTSGPVCIERGRIPLIFRQDAAQRMDLRIDRESGGESRFYSLPAGVTGLKWPAGQLGLESDAYILRQSVGGTQRETRVRFVTIDPGDGGADALAEALVNRGCDVQLDYLADVLTVSEE